MDRYRFDNNPGSGPARSLGELIARDDDAFVRGAYLTLVRREPDAGGFQGYLERLRAGVSKVQIAREIRFSAEGRASGVDLHDWELVAGANPPVGEPARADADAALRGLTESDDGRFIELAYRLILRRSTDFAGKAEYARRMHAGMDRLAVMEALATSTEMRRLRYRLRDWEAVALSSEFQTWRLRWLHWRAVFRHDAGRCAGLSVEELLACGDSTFLSCVTEVVLGRACAEGELADAAERLRAAGGRVAFLHWAWQSDEGRDLRRLNAQIGTAWRAIEWLPIVGKAIRRTRRARVFENLAHQAARAGGKINKAVEVGSGRFGAAVTRATGPSAETPRINELDAAQLDWRIEIDEPAVSADDGQVYVDGPLMLVGWAATSGGVDTVSIVIDGIAIGLAHHGVVRQDVASAMPEWPAALHSGFIFHAPPRALPDGRRCVEIVLTTKSGERHSKSYLMHVRNSFREGSPVKLRRHVEAGERVALSGILEDMDWMPEFTMIVVMAAQFDPAKVRRTLESLQRQWWRRWKALVLVADGNQAQRGRDALGALGWRGDGRVAIDERLALPWGADGTGGGGERGLMGLVKAGDELGADAIGAFALESGLHPDDDLFYADELRAPPGADAPVAFFKPDYSPALLESMSYIGRPVICRPGLWNRTGIDAGTLRDDGLYFATLKMAGAASGVRHLRELLASTEVDAPGDNGLDRLALQKWVDLCGLGATVRPGLIASTWHVRRAVPTVAKISIIICTCAMDGLVEKCLESIRSRSTYRDFEIVCVENIPEARRQYRNVLEAQSDVVIPMPAEFNWSRFNNRGAQAATGDFLLFLNDDTEVVDLDWLESLLEVAAHPGVGAVGARLLYPDGTVQHAGMFLGEEGVGRHPFRFSKPEDPTYFGFAMTRREVIAVTGACLMVRRGTFDALGGFDESHGVINNDLDFCLRVHEAGLRTVYTPFATLIHHEKVSRREIAEKYDRALFVERWAGLFAAGDPYHSPRLQRRVDDFRVDEEFSRATFARHPAILPEEVKSLLVVKLDHIGDFVTAFAAIRRLKAAFPAATLTLVGAPASAALAKLEPAIDRFVSFEFFHARSQLGEREIGQRDWAQLDHDLGGAEFDIAVDLRRHKSTRLVLEHVRARVRAGYDPFGQFPWLDVALDDCGDEPLVHKRAHISDSLINLVTAVENALRPGTARLEPPPRPLSAAEIPSRFRHLFVSQVVAIHAGAGNINKEWPEMHVTNLIRLLVDRDDVSVLLVGGEQDKEGARRIVAALDRPDRVASAAGAFALELLPRLFATCALFIGCDSGPKHLAAASGIPTIGVHSGVVSPVEWVSQGSRSVAMHRGVRCAPCYLARQEDCPRDLACIRDLDAGPVHAMAEKFLARPVMVSRQDDTLAR